MLPVLRRNVPSVWEDPFTPLRNDLDRLFTRWPELGASEPVTLGAYPMDVREDDDNVYVDAEMPGFKKDDIDVRLDDGTLTITAERTPEEFEGTSHLRERRYSRVQRRFALPAQVDESQIDANFQDGVLHLEMKKAGEPKGHRIAVK